MQNLDYFSVFCTVRVSITGQLLPQGGPAGEWRALLRQASHLHWAPGEQTACEKKPLLIETDLGRSFGRNEVGHKWRAALLSG